MWRITFRTTPEEFPDSWRCDGPTCAGDTVGWIDRAEPGAEPDTEMVTWRWRWFWSVARENPAPTEAPARFCEDCFLYLAEIAPLLLAWRNIHPAPERSPAL